MDMEASRSPRVASEDFRRVCGNFATGVAVVTAQCAEGAHGSTVNSFTSLSANAAQIIVCLAKDTTTLRHLRAAGRFAVNVLAADQQDLARHFASKVPDKFAAVTSHPGVNGSPLIDGAMAWLECDLLSLHDGASHLIVVGEATAAGHRPEADPLIFFRSAMGAPIPQRAPVPAA